MGNPMMIFKKSFDFMIANNIHKDNELMFIMQINYC